jgi:hypothetical protein
MSQTVTTPTAPRPPSLEQELEMFRGEEESAQQYFYGYLATQLVPFKNSEVLEKMRETPMFWRTTRYALLMSAFVVLGRIFDQDSKSLHNIDKLLAVVSANIGALSRAGLLQRRVVQGMTPADAAAYASTKYDLTSNDVRAIRKEVAKWRKVYEATYRDIRHKIFAHKGVSSAGADALMAKTNIDEVKEMLGFLHSLYMSLFQLHSNGLKPDLTPTTFSMPPTAYPGSQQSSAAEHMYREAGDLLYGLIDPD